MSSSPGPRRYAVERLVIKDVTHIHDPLENGVLYVSERFSLAIHLCACGCGGKAVTPFRDAERGWILTRDPNGPTLRPSIGHQHWPCGSHYWVTDGQIVPC